MNLNIINLENIYKKRIIGHSITHVYRQFLDDYLQYDGSNDSILEESDGLTYIEFSSGIILAFYANTETNSFKFREIDRKKLPEQHRNFVETSTSLFWLSRINKPIIRMDFIEGNVGLFGLLLTFYNQKTFCLYYESENESVFDALIIRESYPLYGKVWKY